MTVLETLSENRIVAIVRAQDHRSGLEIVNRIIEAGVVCIEVTLTTPGAIEIIESLSAAQHVCIGAGTVLNPKDIPRLRDAGAQFIVSPNSNPRVIVATKEAGLVSIPGVVSPSEVAIALESGADILKLFPASTVGPAHLRALRDPFPGNHWCPTGGLTVESVPQWFNAGATMVGIGGPLLKGGIGEISANVSAFMLAIRASS